MRFSLFFLVGLLLVGSVSGLVAGRDDNVVFSVDKCRDLFVNVSGSLVIEDGEYYFVGCDEISSNYWYCDCGDSFDLVMALDFRVMNNYSFDITYYTETVPGVSRSSRGSRIIIVDGEVVDDEMDDVDILPDDSVVDNVSVVYVNETIVVVEEKECGVCEECEPCVVMNRWWVYFLFGVIGAGLVLLFLTDWKEIFGRKKE